MGLSTGITELPVLGAVFSFTDTGLLLLILWSCFLPIVLDEVLGGTTSVFSDLLFFPFLVSFTFFFFFLGDGLKSLPSDRSHSESSGLNPQKLSESLSGWKKGL